MKLLLQILSISIYLILVQSIGLNAQTFNLNVDMGHGSGIYEKDKTVHVWANQNNDSLIFSHWTGSALKFIDNEHSWHTTLNVPIDSNYSNLTLFANFKPIDIKSKFETKIYTTSAMDDGKFINSYNRKLRISQPDSIAGILFVFQDKDKKVTDFTNNFELRHLAQDAYDRNLLVVLTNSNEISHGNQNNDSFLSWTFNDDYQIDRIIVMQILSQLKTENSLSDTIPTYFLGYREGADFVNSVSNQFPLNAVGLYFPENTTDSLNTIPRFYLTAENYNDDLKNDLYQEYLVSLELSYINQFITHKKQPLNKYRFLRNTTGIDTLVSFALYDTLYNTAGMLDHDNYFMESAFQDFPDFNISNINLTNLQEIQFKYQVNLLLGRNNFTADYNHSLLEFFINPKLNQTKKYSLIVENGFGSGLYEEGEIVHAWANLHNDLFDSWSGDTTVLKNIETHYNQFAMPDTSLHIKANYVPIQHYEIENIAVNDLNFNYHISDSNKAIIVILNGNGSLDYNWQEYFEKKNIIDKLIHNNYGVIIPVSETKEAWDDGDKDFHTVKIFYQSLVNKGLIDRNTQINIIAEKEGTNHINNFTKILHYDFLLKKSSVVNLNGAGNNAFYSESFPQKFPAFWISSGFHNSENPTIIQNILLNYNNNLNKGEDSQHWTNTPQPVYPELFRRLKNVDSNKSLSIYEMLIKLDLLDDEYFYSGDDIGLFELSDSLNLDGILLSDIRRLLLMTKTDEFINSNYSKEIVNFFDRNIDTNFYDTTSVEYIKSNISILPNYDNNSFDVSSFLIKSQEPIEIFSLKLYSANGAIIKQYNNLKFINNQQFSIPNLSNGMYFIDLKFKKNNKIHSLIKKVTKVKSMP